MQNDVRVGDIVTCEGMSAIHGEVTAVGEDGVTVRWMEVQTSEVVDDLILVKKTEVTLDDQSRRTLADRQSKGREALWIAWGRNPEGDERESAARDAISNILTYLYGPAGYYSSRSDDGLQPVDDDEAQDNARELLASARRSYQGDAEDYIAKK